MADWAGAAAACRAQFLAAWVNGPALKTPIGFANEKIKAVDGSEINDAGAPIGSDGAPVPWVAFRVLGNGADLRGIGSPGGRPYLDKGLISISVFGPKDAGLEDIEALAVAAGEIFRAATFYVDNTAAARVTCRAPAIDDGTPQDHPSAGDQFCITCSIPFDFFHNA